MEQAEVVSAIREAKITLQTAVDDIGDDEIRLAAGAIGNYRASDVREDGLNIRLVHAEKLRAHGYSSLRIISDWRVGCSRPADNPKDSICSGSGAVELGDRAEGAPEPLRIELD